MSKTFNTFEKAAIKNAAKAVSHYLAKKDKIDAQIVLLAKQKEALDAEIKVYEDSVASITNGYKPLDLVERVVRTDGSQGDWVFKYKDILPPTNVTESDTELEPLPEVIEIPTDTEEEKEEEEEEKEEEKESSESLPEMPSGMRYEDAYPEENTNVNMDEDSCSFIGESGKEVENDPIDDIF